MDQFFVLKIMLTTFTDNLKVFGWLLAAMTLAGSLRIIAALLGPRIKGAIGEKAVKRALDKAGI